MRIHNDDGVCKNCNLTREVIPSGKTPSVPAEPGSAIDGDFSLQRERFEQAKAQALQGAEEQEYLEQHPNLPAFLSIKGFTSSAGSGGMDARLTPSGCSTERCCMCMSADACVSDEHTATPAHEPCVKPTTHSVSGRTCGTHFETAGEA